MPTTPIGIAKTHRAIIEQQIIGHTLPRELIYRGVTTNATPTEIFILGKVGNASKDPTSVRRLWLPESCLIMYDAFVVAYNVTDDTLIHAAKYVGGVANLNNTVSALRDYDGAGGLNSYVMDTEHAFASAGTCAFTPDNTNKSLNVVVTGVAAKTIEWIVNLVPVNYTSEISSFYYGDKLSSYA